MRPLIRGSIYMKFSDRPSKRRPFNTEDGFIEVPAWAGLTVYFDRNYMYQ